MKRRQPADPAPIDVPPELAAGPSMAIWCTNVDRDALEMLPGDHPQRAAVVWRARHAAWAAFHRARDTWLKEHGYTLRELRAQGLLLYRPPYFD